MIYRIDTWSPSRLIGRPVFEIKMRSVSSGKFQVLFGCLGLVFFFFLTLEFLAEHNSVLGAIKIDLVSMQKKYFLFSSSLTGVAK